MAGQRAKQFAWLRTGRRRWNEADRGGKARLESRAWLATHISNNNSCLQHARVSSFGNITRNVSVIGIALPLIHSIFLDDEREREIEP